jgi:HK97 family phage portal protein
MNWNPLSLLKGNRESMMTLDQANQMIEKASRAMPVIIHASGANPKTANLRVQDYMRVYGSADLASVWVFACVKAIAQTFSTLNLKFYQTTKQRGKKVVSELPDNHPLAQLFWNINPVQTRYDFWENTLISLELTGEFFWALEDMVANKPREIWGLRPDRIEIVPDPVDMIAGYVYKIGSGRVTYLPHEMIFGKYHNPVDEWRGMSPLSAARQSLISESYTISANQNIFKQGMRMSGAFVSDKALNDVTYNRLKTQLNNMYGGVNNFHKNLLLEQGLDFKEMSLNAKDMEWIKQRKINREEILAVYKVPPVKVGIFEYANYANSEAQDKIYWNECVIPRVIKIQEYLNTFLCPRYGKDVYCQFDLSEVAAFKEDEELKSKIAVSLTEGGIKTIDEVREELYNLPPVPWGSTWNAPFNLMPIEVPKKTRNNNDDKKNIKALDASESEKNDRIWKEWDRFLRPLEKKFEAKIKIFFDEQKKRVLGNYDEQTKSYEVSVEKLEEFNPRIMAGLIFDKEKEKFLLEDEMQKTYTGIVEQAGDRAGLAVGIEFNVADPKVLEFLGNKIFRFSSQVSQTTEGQIRQQLLEGIRNGESIVEIRDRIRLSFTQAENVRARRIAQTEVIGASNGAAHQAYNQAGVEKKEWISSRDEKVRDTHVQAELDTAEDFGGDPIPQNEPFALSDGDYLMYPGDSHGKAGNVINCRCTMAPVVS